MHLRRLHVLWTCSSHFNKTEEVRGRVSEMMPAINNNFGMHTEDSRVFVLVLSAQIACSCTLPQQLECNIASGLSSGPLFQSTSACLFCTKQKFTNCFIGFAYRHSLLLGLLPSFCCIQTVHDKGGEDPENNAM